MSRPGTSEQPLQVAIFGAGPAGFYAADALLKQYGDGVRIDLYDRLPTPFGLVRGGVAPDHDKIKSVTKLYERIASQPQVRFFGNVTFGSDILLDDLKHFYHAAIFSVGSSADRRLNIPGEDLPGSYAATEFVGWYNGHPDYRDFRFDPAIKHVAVIGVGNVAMDVTRILARSATALAGTDIADDALDVLRHSQVDTIHVFGRRGPAQAAFTNPEIRELGEIDNADLVIDPVTMQLDRYSAAYLASPEADRKDVRNVEILQGLATQPLQGKPRQIRLHFLMSPLRILGDTRVEAIEMVHNELVEDTSGAIRPRATDRTEIYPVEMVLRSVGYFGRPLAGLPFDAAHGVIPNQAGRVMQDATGSDSLTGVYVAGWIKRGPSGVIGTNKPDAVETVQTLIADVSREQHWQPECVEPDDVPKWLQRHAVHYTTYADWQTLDRIEIARGEAAGRPRLKFTTVDAMLAALADARHHEQA